MKQQILRAGRVAGVVIMGLGVNVGLFANSAFAITQTYFCNGGGTSGNCAQLQTGGGTVWLRNHANASPALSEPFVNTLCGNDYVSVDSHCPFNSNADTLNGTYNGDQIVDIAFDNYTSQCMYGGTTSGTVIGATCGANYTAWVKARNKTYVNIRWTNENYNVAHKAWVLKSSGTGNGLYIGLFDSGLGADETWAGHNYDQ